MADTEYDVTVSVNETVNADVGSTQEQGSQQIGDEVLNLSAESPDDVIVDANITMTEALDVSAEENTGGTDDHRKLYYKDALDQHPIGSITGLQAKLNSVDNTLADHADDITDVGAVAEQAKDSVDELVPIVGSNTDEIENVKEDALANYAELDERANQLANGSLVISGFASIDEDNGIISLYTASNKLQLTGDSMVFSRNASKVAYIMTDDSYGSYLKVGNAMMTYLFMRDPNGAGNLTWIANSNGHLSLKRV